MQGRPGLRLGAYAALIGGGPFMAWICAPFVVLPLLTVGAAISLPSPRPVVAQSALVAAGTLLWSGVVRLACRSIGSDRRAAKLVALLAALVIVATWGTETAWWFSTGGD